MDTRVRNKISLELVQVDIEGTVKAQAGGNRAHNLSDQTVEMLIVWTGDIQAATADVVDSFVINKEGAVSILNSAVGGENGIVWLHDGGRDTWCRVNSKLELALLAIVG